MDSSTITLIVAIVAILIAWKLFKGVVKTAALAVILGVAALFVFGGFA